MKSKTTDTGLDVSFDSEEVQLLEELFGQFTYDTILKIFRDGDLGDALDGNGSETGFEKGGYDAPHQELIDKLYKRLLAYCDANDLD